LRNGRRCPRQVEGREPGGHGARLAAFRALHDLPDNVAAAKASNGNLVQLRAQTSHAAPNDPNEQERPFQQFLEWNWKQSRQ